MTRESPAISVGPGHDRPERARGCLTAGEVVAAAAAHYARYALWLALCQAPDDGADVTEPVRMTGWTRTRRDRHRRQYAGAGRAIGASGGRWAARRTGERSL